MSQTPQLFCPNCKGGNPLTATYCQWCSAPLQGPLPTVATPQKGNCVVPVLVLVTIGLIVACGLLSILSIYGSSRSGSSSQAIGGGSVNQTARPVVQGPSYEEYSSKHKSMTDAQWATYIKTLAGNRITDWKGWVTDVVRDTDMVYDLRVDQDGPDETFAVEDVVIKLSAKDASVFNKHEGVTYSGTIDHIECAIGYCKVIVIGANILH